MDNRIERLNELLERHEKAESYFDNMNISKEEKEIWLPPYIELVAEIEKLWNDMGMGENG